MIWLGVELLSDTVKEYTVPSSNEGEFNTPVNHNLLSNEEFSILLLDNCKDMSIVIS